MTKPSVCVFALGLVACLDLPPEPGIRQLARDSYVELREDCQRLYVLAKGVPAYGWYNQIAIEWYAGVLEHSEGNTKALRTLVDAYGLVTREGFYSWEEPEDKPAVLKQLEKCR